MTPLAVDETGLVAGLLGLGAAFADVSSLRTSAPPQIAGYVGLSLSPNVGPAAGGSRVEISGGSPKPFQNIFFGSQSVADVPTGQGAGATVFSPKHASGPVDVLVQDTMGYLAGTFQAFSYGPTISKVLEGLTQPKAAPR